MSTIGSRIRERREELKMSQEELATKLGYKSRSSINKIELNLRNLTQSKIKDIAVALHVSPAYIMGWEDETDTFKTPDITDEFTEFEIMGDIAAGYDHIANENWTGETVQIPNAYLKGRNKDEYFVLKVKGDSMYPLYQDGDKVLILKQSTLNRSGDIGAILYEDNTATLKKVEYVTGEDWLRLVPINPEFAPKLIKDEELEHCRVIGVPRLLIREIE